MLSGSEEHQAGLIREFLLITLDHGAAGGRAELPGRLAELIVEMLADSEAPAFDEVRVARRWFVDEVRRR